LTKLFATEAEHSKYSENLEAIMLKLKIPFFLILLSFFVFSCSQNHQAVAPAPVSQPTIVEEETASFTALFWEEQSAFQNIGQYRAPQPPQRVQYQVPVEINSRVESCVRGFTTTARERFELWMKRSGLYEEMAKPILASYGIPEDIYYLAMIESGYNPNAYSRAHAAGMWQFISSTGRRYSLNQTLWYDARRDPELATHAACQYLRDLYDEFQSWNLAIAAYNCGEGRIRSRVRDNIFSFWNMRLPRETSAYVPRFLAALILMRNADIFGLPSEDQFYRPEPVEKIEITDCVTLRSVAKAANVPYQEIRRLNGVYRKGITPPTKGTKSFITLPQRSVNTFYANYEKMPKNEKSGVVYHRVQRGETLGYLARQYYSSIQEIMTINNIRNPRRLQIGQRLAIPVHSGQTRRYAYGNSTSQKTYQTKINEAEKTKLEKMGYSFIEYKIRSGETIFEISQKYDITHTCVMRLNRISNSRYVKVGQKILIPVKKS